MAAYAGQLTLVDDAVAVTAATEPVGGGGVTPGVGSRFPVRGDEQVAPHLCPPTGSASMGFWRSTSLRLYTIPPLALPIKVQASNGGPARVVGLPL